MSAAEDSVSVVAQVKRDPVSHSPRTPIDVAAPAMPDRAAAALLATVTTWLGAVGYAFTRSPDAADLSMAAMSSWRRTASAKSGTVWVPLSMSAANAA